MIRLVQNDTRPIYQFAIRRKDKTIPDLSGATVDFKMKAPSGSIINAAHTGCVITDTDRAEGYYAFQSGDLAEAGTYECDLQITFSPSEIQTVRESIQLDVREDAAAS